MFSILVSIILNTLLQYNAAHHSTWIAQNNVIQSDTAEYNTMQYKMPQAFSAEICNSFDSFVPFWVIR